MDKISLCIIRVGCKFLFYTTKVANRLTARLMVNGYCSLWMSTTLGMSRARYRL